jgi:lipoprotein-anchoring transpeptidase ErfK/SrfK
MKISRIAASLILTFVPCAGHALDLNQVNDAELSASKITKQGGIDPTIVKAQILLDRAGFSPGEIDGKRGDNEGRAIASFASYNRLGTTNQLTAVIWQYLTSTSSSPVLTEYTIEDADVRGPFLQRLPAKMEDMKGLKRLDYATPVEGLAEKFHMSEGLLKALNPGESFDRSGETIVVANVSNQASKDKVQRVEVDKKTRQLRAYTNNGELVLVAPVTVGSQEKPAPSGTHTVIGVTQNPTYKYNPAYAFRGVSATRPFTINPGPNNPVGIVWIGLSIKGYGIHGTPDPSKVGKTQSHGCIRLTNWDAKKLAAMTSKGTEVVFLD